jgi:hypothetical protein
VREQFPVLFFIALLPRRGVWCCIVGSTLAKREGFVPFHEQKALRKRKSTSGLSVTLSIRHQQIRLEMSRLQPMELPTRQDPTLQGVCDPSAANSLGPECVTDDKFQRAILSVVLDFVRRTSASSAGNANTAVELLVKFPIAARFRELVGTYAGRDDATSLARAMLRPDDVQALSTSQTSSSNGRYLSAGQAQMFARAFVFLAFHQYRPALDATQLIEWREISAIVEFTGAENFNVSLPRIHSLVVRQIPELKTLLQVLPAQQALVQEQAAELERLNNQRRPNQPPQPPHVAANVAANVPTVVEAITPAVPVVSNAASHDIVTPHNNGGLRVLPLASVPRGSLFPGDVRRDLVEWSEQVAIDAKLETSHSGVLFWHQPHMQFDAICDLYRRVHLFTAKNVATEVPFPPLPFVPDQPDQGLSARAVPALVLRLLAYCWSRESMPFAFDSSDATQLQSLLDVGTDSNQLYERIRELRAWLTVQRKRGENGTGVRLQWFAEPSDTPIWRLDLEVLQALRRVLVVSPAESVQPALDAALSLQINGYFDSWLRPLLTAICVLDPEFWRLEGNVWHSYFEQMTVYVVSNRAALHLPFVSATRARITSLLGELLAERAGKQTQKDKLQLRQGAEAQFQELRHLLLEQTPAADAKEVIKFLSS